MKGSSKLSLILVILIILIGGGLYFYYFQKSEEEPETFSSPTSQLNMNLSSSAFEDNQLIPLKYTCDGLDVNPPLEISKMPEKAKSLVLIVDDPDAPLGVWTHWLVWNIDPKTSLIDENSLPEGAVEGVNSFKKHAYGGPCPPGGTHHYFFKLYALDIKLEIDSSLEKGEVEAAMDGHILDSAELVGLYSRE